MKVYTVVNRDGRWHAIVPGTGQMLGSYEDKAVMVGWTRAFARKHDGEVQVLDENGEVEAVYRFMHGVELH